MKLVQQTIWGTTESLSVDSKDKASKNNTLQNIDPRTDLNEDSKDWDKLLKRAQEKNTSLAKILHGFRCGGLRLEKDFKGHTVRHRLRPDFSNSIWKSQEEYDADKKKWLMPYQQQIIDLLEQQDYLDGFEEVEG